MSSTYETRLQALRAILKTQGLDGFIIPRSDEHLGEYVPKCSERLAFISGFTGSAGLAIVLADRAAIFSDGRYSLQLQTETDGTIWERLHITEAPPETWLKAHALGLRIGYDPWLISADGLRKYAEFHLVPVTSNPLDDVWEDRPAISNAYAIAHDSRFAGEDSAAKRERLAAQLRDCKQDGALLTDPASLAWLFNLRGSDMEFTPVALGYAILNADASATIFMHLEKIPAETRIHLGNQVSVLSPSELPDALEALKDRTIRYDPSAMPVWFSDRLKAAGAVISEGVDVVALPRAQKNMVEQDGARAAHLRDGLAVTRFLAWLSARAPSGGETELSAAAKLLDLRSKGEYFRGESFPAISAAGEHGAIIHYRVTAQSNRLVKPDEVYLIDSGGQYSDGTTDITRTVWTGPASAPSEVKANATRVLAGHIALSSTIFPEGVAGAHLDALARQALWQVGMDYDHGTGHGVGAYLSVHEGPVGISRAAKPVALRPGMILSNEPGFYLAGAYGIRMENLELVQPATFSHTERKFLRFETLTLAPFDRALIEPNLLTPSAREWLNQYHTHVRETLRPLLNEKGDEAAVAWLEAATAPI